MDTSYKEGDTLSMHTEGDVFVTYFHAGCNNRFEPQLGMSSSGLSGCNTFLDL
jgi:hypothetical protein